MDEPTKPAAAGAAPTGANDEQSAATPVREMFTAIAPRYDLLNHLLSLNVDRLWWRRAARTFAPILARHDAQVLDLCCGTADMALALRRQGGNSSARIFGADFSHAMLRLAAHKSRGHVTLLEADALRLPLPDERFDLVVSAFGFRNLTNYDAGLREIFRVLRPGGEIGVLDFGQPGGPFGRIYRFYFRRVLPIVGTAISGVKGPYSYLPASVERFPHPEQMLDHMRAAGFRDVSWTPYTLAIAGLYRGRK